MIARRRRLRDSCQERCLSPRAVTPQHVLSDFRVVIRIAFDSASVARIGWMYSEMKHVSLGIFFFFFCFLILRESFETVIKIFVKKMFKKIFFRRYMMKSRIYFNFTRPQNRSNFFFFFFFFFCGHIFGMRFFFFLIMSRKYTE